MWFFVPLEMHSCKESVLLTMRSCAAAGKGSVPCARSVRGVQRLNSPVPKVWWEASRWSRNPKFGGAGAVSMSQKTMVPKEPPFDLILAIDFISISSPKTT